MLQATTYSCLSEPQNTEAPKVSKAKFWDGEFTYKNKKKVSAFACGRPRL